MTHQLSDKINRDNNSLSLMSEQKSSNNLGKRDVNGILLHDNDVEDLEKHKEDFNNAESESVGSKEESVESDVNTNISSLSNGDYHDNNYNSNNNGNQNSNDVNNNNKNNNNNQNNEITPTTLALQTNIEYAKKECIERMHDLLKLRSEPNKAIESMKKWEEILTPNVEFFYPTTSYRPFPPNQMDLDNCRRVLRGVAPIVEDTISLGVFLNLLIPCPLEDVNDAEIEFPNALGMNIDMNVEESGVRAGAGRGRGRGTTTPRRRRSEDFQNGSHVKYDMKLVKGTTVVSADVVESPLNPQGEDADENENENEENSTTFPEVDVERVERRTNNANSLAGSSGRKNKNNINDKDDSNEEEILGGTSTKSSTWKTSSRKSNKHQRMHNNSSNITSISGSSDNISSENSVSKLQINFTLMSQWTLKTTTATACGAPAELTKTGMLYANYNSSLRINTIHILFDVMGFVQQLRRLKSSMKMWTGLGLGLGLGLGFGLGSRETRRGEGVGSRGNIPLPSITTSASATSSSSSSSSSHSKSNQSAISAASASTEASRTVDDSLQNHNKNADIRLKSSFASASTLNSTSPSGIGSSNKRRMKRREVEIPRLETQSSPYMQHRAIDGEWRVVSETGPDGMTHTDTLLRDTSSSRGSSNNGSTSSSRGSSSSGSRGHLLLHDADVNVGMNAAPGVHSSSGSSISRTNSSESIYEDETNLEDTINGEVDSRMHFTVSSIYQLEKRSLDRDLTLHHEALQSTVMPRLVDRMDAKEVLATRLGLIEQSGIGGHIPKMIVQTTSPHGIVAVNPAWELMMGYDREEVLQAEYTDSLVFRDYSDVSTYKNVVDLKEAIEQSRPHSTILSITDRLGARLRTFVCVFPLYDIASKEEENEERKDESEIVSKDKSKQSNNNNSATSDVTDLAVVADQLSVPASLSSSSPRPRPRPTHYLAIFQKIPDAARMLRASLQIGRSESTSNQMIDNRKDVEEGKEEEKEVKNKDRIQRTTSKNMSNNNNMYSNSNKNNAGLASPKAVTKSKSSITTANTTTITGEIGGYQSRQLRSSTKSAFRARNPT